MLNDFHVHSTESDGQLSPEELLDLAMVKGVSVIALCDHDTTAGLNRFITYGRKLGISALGGIEISAKWNSGNCHILGLGLKANYEPLEIMLKKTRDSRDRRNELILEKLASLGIQLSTEQLIYEAGGEVVGRPHIAAALLRAGFVGTLQEAFDKYLSREGLAYVDRFRLEPVKAVSLLCDAGAFPVLAHPSQLKLNDSELFDLIIELKNAGLRGLEVFSPHTTDKQIDTYKEMAKALGLAVTGGSDFHMLVENGRVPGFFRPDVPIPQLDIPELTVNAA